MKIAIVGFGNMGKTFANGFINARFIDLNHLYVFKRSPINTNLLDGIPPKNIFYELNPVIKEVDIIILAVKPQDFETLASILKQYISNQHIVLSVMAGVSINKIQQLLCINKVIRSMPNLPSQIGLGTTVLTASESIDRKDLFIIQNLINTTGKSIFVENEKLIDAATAVSGSGPAYVFYFMQAMIEAAQSMGFSEAEAELLVKQTFVGAVQLYSNNAISTAEWITKVASKGGTTEEALKCFEEAFVKQKIKNGVEAARLRSVQLGS